MEFTHSNIYELENVEKPLEVQRILYNKNWVVHKTRDLSLWALGNTSFSDIL